MVAGFISAPLNEELNICAPPGTDQLPDGCVSQLKKSLYGLKKSTKQWNDILKRFLTFSCGLKQLRYDECLFFKGSGKHFMLVAIYVDDIVIACNFQSMLRSYRDNFDYKIQVQRPRRAVEGAAYGNSADC